MEVHFCDLCNESVPERDLLEGRAFLRKGRVVCASCDLAMGGDLEQPPAELYRPAAVAVPVAPLLQTPAPLPAAGAAVAPAAPAGNGLALTLATLGILLTACLAVLLFDRLDAAGRDAAGEQARARSELQKELDALRAEVGSGSAERALEAQQLQSDLSALGERQERRAREATEAVERVAADLSALAQTVDAGSGLGEDLARNAQEVETLASVISEMRGDIGVLAEKLVELERRPSGPGTPGPVAGAPGVGGGPAPAAAGAGSASPPPAPAADGQPAWSNLLAELKSTSSGARWSAVQALGDTHDPAVVPHLLPMLKDADIFVRMATARVLGDLAVVDAVPHLIDALEDEEASVREQALVSLRELTGKDFKFDPTANEAERAKKIKAWRDWWKREGEPAAAG